MIPLVLANWGQKCLVHLALTAKFFCIPHHNLALCFRNDCLIQWHTQEQNWWRPCKILKALSKTIWNEYQGHAFIWSSVTTKQTEMTEEPFCLYILLVKTDSSIPTKLMHQLGEVGLTYKILWFISKSKYIYDQMRSPVICTMTWISCALATHRFYTHTGHPLHRYMEALRGDAMG